MFCYYLISFAIVSLTLKKRKNIVRSSLYNPSINSHLLHNSILHYTSVTVTFEMQCHQSTKSVLQKVVVVNLVDYNNKCNE